VAVCGPLKFSGYLAWFAWLLIHVMNLVEFRDRLFVLLEWAWSYITWNRGARLITGADRPPVEADFIEEPAGTEQAGRASD
jgi:NADH dehydrogenase